MLFILTLITLVYYGDFSNRCVVKVFTCNRFHIYGNIKVALGVNLKLYSYAYHSSWMKSLGCEHEGNVWKRGTI